MSRFDELREKISNRKSINTQTKVPKLNPTRAVDKRIERRLKMAGYDADFLMKVQPQGGMTFDDSYAIAGDGYSACLTLINYDSDPDYLWGTELSLYDATMTTFDVGTDSTEKIKGQINRSLQELGDRAENGRRTTDMNDANNEYQNLLNFTASLTQDGEIPKKVVTRIFVYAPTIELLQERIRNIKADLKGHSYLASVQMFFQGQQFQSLSQSLMMQEATKGFGPLPEQSMPSATLGGGVMFTFQDLKDPRGLPIGSTKSGGAFLFDQFRTTDIRTSFNMMVLGKMGMGKSTLLKMLTEGSFARDMYWRGIDKTGEYSALIKSLGGTVVALDGSDGIMNPLEVMATNIDEKTGKVDEIASFMAHKSKVETMLRMINDDFTPTELSDLDSILTSFYIQCGLLPKRWQREDRDKVHITGLPADAYPIFSDFRKFVDKLNEEDYLDRIQASRQRRRTFEKIKILVHSLIDGNGNIFDGHSTIGNLNNQKLVLFDTSRLSTGNKSIYRAQLFQALTLIWNQALLNGRHQNELIAQGKLEPDYKQYFNVVLDECHNIINYENIFAVDYIKNFEREMRKFNAGIIFATQSPEEMVPDGISSEKLSGLKTVFELCQYKVFYGMDASQTDKIKKLLKESLTESDYNMIPNLKRREAIWNLGSTERFLVKHDASKEELALFGGGQ